MYFNKYYLLLDNNNIILGKECSSNTKKDSSTISYVRVTKRVFDKTDLTNREPIIHGFDKICLENSKPSNELDKTIEAMEKEFLTKCLDQHLPLTSTTRIGKMFFTYNLDLNKCTSIQMSWVYNNTNYAAKFDGNCITDLYEMPETTPNISYEIDINTLRPLVKYVNSNKYTLDNKLLQVNNKIKSYEDIPPDFKKLLDDVEFNIDDIVFFSTKPYGRVVEVLFK